MKRIAAQSIKELKHFQRDRLTMTLSVLMPLVMLWLFGATLTLDPDNVALVIDDLDQTPTSRAYVEAFAASNEFVFVPRNPGTRLVAALDEGRASAALLIPPGFERDLQSHKPAPAQLLLDGTDANMALVLRQEAQAITQTFLGRRGSIPPAALEVEIRYWYNPGLADRVFFGTGALGVVLIFFPALLGATATAREHELGTAIQVYSSNLTANEWTLGKALPCIAIGLLQFILCFVVGTIFFSYRIPSDPTPLLAGTILYIATGVFFGMWLGHETKSQAMSIHIVQLGLFIVSMLLSGFLTPIENTPVQLRWISYLVPATYYIELVRDGILRDGGWVTGWAPASLLAALATGTYLTNIFQIRKMRFED
jgi:ABC-2 type transport system permease protein